MHYLIRQRPDITKKQKLDFFVDVLRTDHSLKVNEEAAKLFNELSGQKFDTIYRKPIIEWYDKHSREID